jgi:hypothetical protein
MVHDVQYTRRESGSWLDFSFRRFRGFSIVVYTRGLWLCLMAVLFPPVNLLEQCDTSPTQSPPIYQRNKTTKHPFRSNFSTHFIHQPRICHDDIPTVCSSPRHSGSRFTVSIISSWHLASLRCFSLSLACGSFAFLLSWGRTLQRPPGRCLLIAIPWSVSYLVLPRPLGA